MCSKDLFDSSSSALEKVFIARYVLDSRINIDGENDEPSWVTTSKYAFTGPKNLKEGGWVSFLWNEQYLYIYAYMVDSDVVTESEKDQIQQFQFGDVVEIFFKSANDPSYWELQFAPNGKKSVFWFPSRGRILPSCYRKDYSLPLKFAVAVDGSLNNWNDKDKGWKIEIAIPWKELSLYADETGNGLKGRWYVLIGRYNYSRYFTTSGPELSSVPSLPRIDFHLVSSYMPIVLKR